jgi:hypothetical protein
MPFSLAAKCVRPVATQGAGEVASSYVKAALPNSQSLFEKVCGFLDIKKIQYVSP